MEHKLGEIVTLPDGRKAVVVESDGSCHECVMTKRGLCWNIKCIAAERVLIDHKNIIYKEIKEGIDMVPGQYLCKVKGLQFCDYAILRYDVDGWWQYIKEYTGDNIEGWVGNSLEIIEAITLLKEE